MRESLSTEGSENNRGHCGASLEIVFVLCAVALTVASVVHLMFSDREVHPDEIALHNPVYMAGHYGEVRFPPHLRFYDLIIHPPVHYGLVARLMQAGLSLFHAAGSP